MPVTAAVKGTVVIIKGVGPLFEQWASRDQANNTWTTNKNSKQTERAQYNGAFRRIPISSLTDSPTLVDDDDGPNHKGTYSKAYTINHPEIKWVHRGQGRYLPTETISNQESRTQSGLTPSSKPTHASRFSGRSSLRRRSGDVDAPQDDDEDDDDDDEEDVDADDDEVPFTSQRSQASKRLSDASYSLRNRQSEADPLTPGALRAARQQRRSGPLTNFEDEDDAEDESESGDDEMKTYTKEYKEAHPEHNWRHCGNGFYKKGEKPSIPSSQYRSRRGSSRSQVKTESDLPAPPQEVKRYRLQDFHKFPSDEPVHCGNGWYRRKSSLQGTPDYGRRSSLQSTPDHRRRTSLHETPDQSAIESSDDEVVMKDGKFSKEEMVHYKNNFPDAQFVHRGNGRYVLTDDSGTIVQNTANKPSAAAAATAAAAPEEPADKTFSKAYVKQHPNESFFHAGSGRYRRGSRPKRSSDASRKPDPPVVEKPAIPTGLVNKDFVLSHPEMEFHHRGQGRYMYGPRPLEPVSAPAHPPAPTPVKEPDPSPAPSEPELVDTAYVDAHPYETFHHRGQGRWARGLPPPGSSNKTAVRGPMASQAKFSVTPSHPPPEPLPGLEELLIRSEGPDKYPHLEWVYRGGGKWARTPKSKPQPPKTSRARVSRGTIKAQEEDEDSEESQEVVYTDDEYAGRYHQDTPNESRRQSLNNGIDQRAAVPTRRQRAYQRAEPIEDTSRQTSKNPSHKSKTATPKPQRLTLEEDRLSDEDNYPSLHAKAWPPPRTDEPFDEASRVMRRTYKPLNSADKFINALTRRDPATRPKELLLAVTAHVQGMLQELQDEYLELDAITAPHARVPRKPVKGGRVPLDHAVFEDKKEADLYDYTFDPRKVGYQDPEAQKIYRDAEGRALRKRRQRNGLDAEPAATTGGEEAPLGPRRAVKPISRFDGTTQAPTRKKRTNNGTVKPASSMTPDPSLEPQVLANGYVVHSSGRWAGHIPKRIRELRGDSVGAASPSAAAPATTPATNGGATSPGAPSAGADEGASRSETPGTSSDTPGPADGKEGSPGASRKGRPKGSKNLHKRRDAGIPKGPRKPKVVPSIEQNASNTFGFGLGPDRSQTMYGGGMGMTFGASVGGAAPTPAVAADAAAVAAMPAPAPRQDRNDPWFRLGSSRIGYPFD